MRESEGYLKLLFCHGEQDVTLFSLTVFTIENQLFTSRKHAGLL